MKVSVILCTHNPKEAYLSQTAQGLIEQVGIDFADWELLVIDNLSSTPVESLAINWPPQVRFIVEEQLGLTPARLRGIEESRSDLLLFVDDDNVLAADYLAKGLQISAKFAVLGAWGGSTLGVYENEPPAWFHQRSSFVGVREIENDAWGNSYYNFGITPIGAGMFIRKEVASEYASLLKRDPKRQELDRKGSSLISCGDIDMANVAVDMGLGMGVFERLSLNHLIPPVRYEMPYLMRLAYSIGQSQVMVRQLRGVENSMRTNPYQKLGDLLIDYRKPKEVRRLRRQIRKGQRDALASIATR